MIIIACVRGKNEFICKATATELMRLKGEVTPATEITFKEGQQIDVADLFGKAQKIADLQENYQAMSTKMKETAEVIDSVLTAEKETPNAKL